MSKHLVHTKWRHFYNHPTAVEVQVRWRYTAGVCQTYLSSGLTVKDSWLIQVQGVESLGGCADNSGNWKGVWGRGKTEL